MAHKTNVITSSIVLQIGKDIAFHNGEDLPEVTVNGMDSINHDAGKFGKILPADKQNAVRVVYHLTYGIEEAQRGLENIRAHLIAEPNVKIVVVVNGKGVESMLEGTKDGNGNLFATAIKEIKRAGVDFLVCHNTLNTLNIDKSRVIAEASIIPLGVAEVARLQQKEGYAYLRP